MGLLSFLTRKHPKGRPPNVDRPDTADKPPLTILDSRFNSQGKPGASNSKRRSLLKGSGRPYKKPPKPYFLGIRDEDGSLQHQEHPAVRPRGPTPHNRQRPGTPNNRRRRSMRQPGPDPKAPNSALTARPTIDKLPSAGRLGRYVDILDAQSEFKQCDFKSRVLASGARDYGEDVAERNMRHITADLASSATLVDHISAAGAPRASHRKGVHSIELGRDSEGSILSVAAFAEPGWIRSTHSRRQRCNSSPPMPIHSNPQHPQWRTKSSRARSLEPTYLNQRSRFDPHPPASLFYRAYSDFGHGSRNEPYCTPRERMVISGKRHTDDRRDHYSQRRLYGDRTHGTVPLPRSRSRSASPPEIRRFRANSTQPQRVPRKTIRQHNRARSVDVDIYNRPRSPYTAPPRTRTLNLRDLMEPDLAYSPSPASRHGRTRTSRARPQFEDHGEHGKNRQLKPRSFPLVMPETTDEDTPRKNSAANTTDGRAREQTKLNRRSQEKRASWQVAQDHALRDALAAKLARVRSASDVGQANPLTMDIAGHVPDRTSSLKQWSIASLTPTTDRSDHSSVHARPRSIHTANTSVDLPPLISPDLVPGYENSSGAKYSPGRRTTSSYLGELDEDTSSDTDVASRVDSHGGARLMGDYKSRLGDANGGEWLSTDYSEVDSFAEQQQLRHMRDDESLLFKPEEIGDADGNLPGLQERPQRSPCLMCSLLERAAPESYMRSKRPGSWGSKGPCNHKNLSTPRDRLLALGYDYETDDSDPGAEDKQRGRLLEQQKSDSYAIGAAHRLPFGGGIQEAEEEEDDKTRTIHTLRREPRTRERRIETCKRGRGFESVKRAYEHRLAADD
ncbi:hypothetical protein HIM_03392 [Hirsutella minnesotensis 3608]|uniref:Uncharacterized protein n=1 Tax=Hirsutella minnesotensis 3608 TaxID=1043627 RepID=A0A0F7ZM92_9HYPO|nr:hypothetical protein HIM_03392 [Hirsutella minnesotensis 3608]